MLHTIKNSPGFLLKSYHLVNIFQREGRPYLCRNIIVFSTFTNLSFLYLSLFDLQVKNDLRRSVSDEQLLVMVSHLLFSFITVCLRLSWVIFQLEFPQKFSLLLANINFLLCLRSRPSLSAVKNYNEYKIERAYTDLPAGFSHLIQGNK